MGNCGVCGVLKHANVQHNVEKPKARVVATKARVVTTYAQLRAADGNNESNEPVVAGGGMDLGIGVPLRAADGNNESNEPVVAGGGMDLGIGVPLAVAPLVEKLEAKRQMRLAELGVDRDKIVASKLLPLNRSLDNGIRFMQWNLLADGMSNDGFLVQDVLAQWPAGRGNVPTIDGNHTPYSRLLDDIMDAKGDEKLLRTLKEKFNVPASQDNLRAIVDWDARELQILLQVLAADRPDVLVFQEVDHYASLSVGLSDLGYTSQRATTHTAYRPAYLAGHDDKTVEGQNRFVEAVEKEGHAFLPKLASHSMFFKLAQKKASMAAVAKRRNVEDEVLSGGKVSKQCFVNLGENSENFLREAEIDPLSVDNDGVAIFWRADKFDAASIRAKMFPEFAGGVLEVQLREKYGYQRHFTAIGAHLSSGDSKNDEEKRVCKQVACDTSGTCSSLLSILRAATESGEPVVLCMDANSHPQIAQENHLDDCCWSLIKKEMKSTRSSVWDGYFDHDGKATVENPPVTSNKLRGPLSDQAKKIGQHAYCLIDHIFYDDAHFEFSEHVYRPHQYQSASVAKDDLQPSLHNPSDHYPVIVDFGWRLP